MRPGDKAIVRKISGTLECMTVYLNRYYPAVTLHPTYLQRARQLEQECIKSCLESNKFTSTLCEVREGQEAVEKEAEQISETLDRISTHFRAPAHQYVVEAILIFLVAGLILLICNSLSLKWLLCFNKAVFSMPKPM